VTFKTNFIISSIPLLILCLFIFPSCNKTEITTNTEAKGNQQVTPKPTQPIVKIQEANTPASTPNPSPTPELEALFIYNQGVRAFRVEEYNDAVTSFNMVIKRLPEIALGYKARGGAYYKLEKYDKAKKDLQKAIALDPEIGGAYMYLGLMSRDSGNITQAKTQLQKALTLIHPIREKWEYYEAENALRDLNQ